LTFRAAGKLGGREAGVVKNDDFYLTSIIPFLFRYKLGAIFDFRIGILDLRNAVHYNR
jgi:hypothetical protein